MPYPHPTISKYKENTKMGSPGKGSGQSILQDTQTDLNSDMARGLPIQEREDKSHSINFTPYLHPIPTRTTTLPPHLPSREKLTQIKPRPANKRVTEMEMNGRETIGDGSTHNRP